MSEVFRIEIPIQVEDNTDPGVSQATRKMNAFDKVNQKTQERLNQMNRTRYQVVLDALDRASGTIGKVSAKARGIAGRTFSFTLKAVDMVTKPFRSILSGLNSALGLMGAGIGVAGGIVLPLNLTIQQQNIETAFEVLLGSAEAAKKRVDELTTFAGQTPFTRDDIYEASRILQVFTGNALSTGDGLRMIGDVAAGTQQEFGDVALWMGRLYDAMASGRPVGDMTSRLQEMGAISGDARNRIEMLADSGLDISKTWPEATKEFARFDGIMEKLSGNLANLLLGVKSFFTNNIIKRWGAGLTTAITPALESFREWRQENTEGIARMGDMIERFGERTGGALVGFAERTINKISAIMSDPRFDNATTTGKFKIILDDISKSVSQWSSGPGSQVAKQAGETLGDMVGIGLTVATPALTQVGMVLGEAAAKGAMTAFGAALKSSPIGALVIGALGGAAVGSVIPGVGTVTGGLAGAGSGLFTWVISNVFGGGSSVEASTGYSSTPAYNYPSIPTTSPFASSPFVTPITLPEVMVPAATPPSKPRPVAIPTTSPFASSPFVTPIKLPIKPMVTAEPAITPMFTSQPSAVQGSGGRAGAAAATPVTKLPSMDTSAYLNSEVYEPFKNIVDRSESWGRNLIVNFMRGRDSAGMSMGGWLNTKVYEPFRSIVNRSESWGRNLIRNYQSGIDSVQITIPTIPAPSVTTAPVTARADGGILTQPHLGLVAEAGPEAIIPLTKPARAWDLWHQVGDRMGFTETRNKAINTKNMQLVTNASETTKRLADVVDITRYRNLKQKVNAYAEGGILSQPHMGLVAEAGPEAIIPLTKPSRAQVLWRQVGDRMGFFPNDNEREREKIMYTTPTKITQQSMTLGVPDITPDTPTSSITRSISEPLENLRTEAQRIITRERESVSRATSIVERIKNTARTRLMAAAGGYSGPAAFQPLVVAAAAKYGIPAGILSGLIQAESSWRPNAVSPVGALGLTQVMPGTARGMGYSVEALRRSPALQIEAGAKYLSQQYSRFNNWSLALAAYNAGPGAVTKYGGIPPYRETQNYVAKILSPAKHAEGGILTKPHMGMVAEDGAEGIIPLSPSKRSRGIDLWQRTGEILGVRPYEDGGIVGDEQEQRPKGVPTGGGGQNITIKVEVKAEPKFTIEGSGDATDENKVLAVLKAYIREMADDIGDELAERLARIFANMPVKGGA